MDEEPKKLRLPRWAKRLLVVLSIVGPLTGAVVTIVSAIYDIQAKAKDAKTETKASYETLAPAVKELQDLLAKTQDVVDVDEKEIAALKAVKDEQEKRIIRLEAYVDILGHRGTFPAPPPKVKAGTGPVATKSHKLKPASPVPVDVTTAKQYQDVRVQLQCSPNDPTCDSKAADMAAEKR